jgi:DNA polymerase
MENQEVRRQLLDRLKQLHSAGVGWLPSPPPFEPAVAASPAQAAPLPQTEARAFDIAAEEPSPALPIEERRLALQTLAAVVAKCTRCPELCSTRTQTVFADGNPAAELCFIGEAPGADEDAQGVPFVGAAGQLLNKIITACGFTRQEVYICNILKCRPPQNRLPLPDEAANCREYLDKQLALVQPRYIVALGACAAQNLLGTTVAIGRLRGRFHTYQGIPVLATYHPAFLLRSPNMKKEVWADMKMLLAKMGRPVPQS